MKALLFRIFLCSISAAAGSFPVMAGIALPLIVSPSARAASLMLRPVAFAPGKPGKRNSCSIAAGGLAFGNYDPLSGSVATTSAAFTVNCTHNVKVTVAFSTGQSGTYTQRYMKAGGTDQLDYNIYTDTTYTTIVGDGTAGTSFYTGKVKKHRGYTAYYYGLMPASQNVGPGSYSDVITVTVTY